MDCTPLPQPPDSHALLAEATLYSHNGGALCGDGIRPLALEATVAALVRKAAIHRRYLEGGDTVRLERPLDWSAHFASEGIYGNSSNAVHVEYATANRRIQLRTYRDRNCLLCGWALLRERRLPQRTAIPGSRQERHALWCRLAQSF